MMEEALQDIPPLVYDIQERLKGISESVAVDGKPRSKLPNRRLLWDRLKPQASAVSFNEVVNISEVTSVVGIITKLSLLLSRLPQNRECNS